MNNPGWDTTSGGVARGFWLPLSQSVNWFSISVPKWAFGMEDS